MICPIQARDHGGDSRRHQFIESQGLDDAIAFRLARLAGPCPDCDEANGLCDDHYCDVDLISGYRQRAAAKHRQ